MDVALALITLAFGVMRFFITPRLDLPTMTGCYEAFVHLFVGGLIGAYIVKRNSVWLVLAVCITILEVVMFLVQKVVQ